jgi:hypothetical protein
MTVCCSTLHSNRCYEVADTESSEQGVQAILKNGVIGMRSKHEWFYVQVSYQVSEVSAASDPCPSGRLVAQ